jgi:hypothetical protein
MMATAFWDVYGVIMLVDFIPPSSTVNAAAYQYTTGGNNYLVRRSRIIF